MIVKRLDDPPDIGVWQPIEIAPTDTPVLVWDGEDISIAHLSNLIGIPTWFVEAGSQMAFDSGGDLINVGPSFWMTLPAPPTLRLPQSHTPK